MPDPWTALGIASRLAIPRLKELVLGTPEERGAAKALAKAAWATAVEVLPSADVGQVEHFAASLLLHLDSDLLDVVVEEGAMSRTRLLGVLEEALSPLSEPVRDVPSTRRPSGNSGAHSTIAR